MPGVRTAIPAQSEPGLTETKATAERVDDAVNGDRLKLKLPDPLTTSRIKLVDPTLGAEPLEAGSAE